jgi:deazaflavin-dependent oxidoreductase (nitroreductase family)
MANPARQPPRWLVRLNIVMLRLGVPVGSQRVLSVVGRKSGLLRHTPVSLVTIGDRRYIVAAVSGVDWVKNARAAGVGLLRRGKRREEVRLVELPVDQRPPVLREFLRQVPGGVKFFGVSSDPEVLAASAAEYPVFRLVSTST